MCLKVEVSKKSVVALSYISGMTKQKINKKDLMHKERAENLNEEIIYLRWKSLQ